MDQLRDYADPRLLGGCTYCGGPAETRDHVPPRVFLDEPYPANLPVVAACWSCNNELGRDEEYLACLVESVISGSADPAQVRRTKVAVMLRRNVALRALLEAAQSRCEGGTVFSCDSARVERVLLKLARAHAAYELSSLCRGDPTLVSYRPLCIMSDNERDDYEASEVIHVWGEVGSRGMQRECLMVAELLSTSGERLRLGAVVNDWIEVQTGRYRYLAHAAAGELKIKVIISEYLACEVSWRDDVRVAGGNDCGSAR
jgi:hypothetical protein